MPIIKHEELTKAAKIHTKTICAYPKVICPNYMINLC